MFPPPFFFFYVCLFFRLCLFLILYSTSRIPSNLIFIISYFSLFLISFFPFLPPFSFFLFSSPFSLSFPPSLLFPPFSLLISFLSLEYKANRRRSRFPLTFSLQFSSFSFFFSISHCLLLPSSLLFLLLYFLLLLPK